MMLGTRETILLGLIDAVRDRTGEGDDGEGDAAYGEALASLFAHAQRVRDDEQVPDPMPAGWNRPAPASERELVETLVDVLDRVQAGDSFEGFVQWSMPTDEPELADADYGLMARYRVGNRDGQGGLRVFAPEALDG